MAKKFHALIIGAGFTGCALAYDLAKRGLDVTVVERGEIVSGTSGRTHGLLHSGARYCVNDKESAIECIEENIILRKIAKQCIEFNGGLFVALDDDDVGYAEKFSMGAEECRIPIQKISGKEAVSLEPNLNPKAIMAFHVPDGTFDPLRLALAFAASAKKYGAKFMPFREVKGLLTDQSRSVLGAKIWDRTNNKEFSIQADITISAVGGWAGEVAKMVGAVVPITPTPGVMVAYDKRLLNRVVNRLNKPGDGDILLPQRRMVVIGTTSFEVTDLDYIPVFEDQVKLMYDSACELVPAVKTTKMRGAYMATRPLVGKGQDGRSLARTFKCFDHRETDGIDNFVTITGGKATTCRVMAEKTADLVCSKLGLDIPCHTREEVLVSYREYYRS
ncbi:MAG TPA: FAD-dependent oxidoreductase [Anaerolineaceae bacterium]